MSDPSLIQCANCGATNRVPRSELEKGRQPICGRCKTRLSSSNDPFPVTDSTFNSQVELSKLPVLLDAWAPWCGPCRAITPALDSIAAEMAGQLRVGKLNVDDNPLTSSRFRIQSIPCLLLFRDGREIDRIVGAQPKQAITSWIKQALA